MVLGPAGVGERKFVFLLPEGAARFLVLGVFGEFDTFAVIFVPLAVFLSSQIILSKVGDEETVRGRFPRIGSGIKEQWKRV